MNCRVKAIDLSAVIAGDEDAMNLRDNSLYVNLVRILQLGYLQFEKSVTY